VTIGDQKKRGSLSAGAAKNETANLARSRLRKFIAFAHENRRVPWTGGGR